MALEEARAEVKRLKTEMYVMKVQEQDKSKNMRQLTQKEIFHNNITGSPVVAGAENHEQYGRMHPLVGCAVGQ